MQYISKGIIFAFLAKVFLRLVLNFPTFTDLVNMNYATLKAENPVKNVLLSGLRGVKMWQVLSKTCLELLKTKVQLLSVVSFFA